MNTLRWDIGRAGRAWTGTESHERANRRPEQLEMFEGKLLLTDEDRLNLLGMLLENVGADQAVRLGDPKVWIDAAETLRPAWARRSFLGDRFNRWMLMLWCVNLVVIAGVVFIAVRRPELPPLSPSGEALLLCALVALWTSLAVNAFLKL